MTNDLRHGLNLLAEEVDPSPVDTYSIIKKANARTRNQRMGLASALGTVAVAVAMAATIGLTGSTSDPVRLATPPTSTDPGAARICGKTENCPVADPQKYPSDAQAKRLDAQLAPVRDSLLLPGSTLERAGLPMFDDVEPLQFALITNQDGAPSAPPVYEAVALMRTAEGTAALSIQILKLPPGTPFGPVQGRALAPCDGVPGCERRQLSDGTVATALADGNPPGIARSSTITAQRPDGTYVQVFASVGPAVNENPMPAAPFTTDDLFEFATVFTY